MLRHRHILVHVVLWSIVGMTLLPLIWFFLTSLKSTNETFQIPPAWFFSPTLDHYRNVLGMGGEIVSSFQGGSVSNIGKGFVNSTIIAVGATGLSTVLGTIAAFGFARFTIRGEHYLLGLYLLIRMVPAVSMVLPLYHIFSMAGLNDTYIGVIIAESTFQVPFVVWMMTGFIRQIPASLEESAMMDGMNRLSAMVRITLPLASAGLFATVIFNFVQVWNDFLYPLVLTSQSTQTLPVMIIGFIANGNIFWGEMAAAGILIILPVVLISLVAQKYVLAGATAGAIKG